MHQEEPHEHSESQIHNEEAKIWKKNAPYLYDCCITHILEWPSLTVQWLPNDPSLVDQSEASDKFIRNKMIIGTQTNGEEPNYLMIANVRLPSEATNVDAEDFKLTQRQEGQPINNNSFQIQTRILHDGEVNKALFMPQKYNIIATKTNSGQVHIFDYSLHGNRPKTAEVTPNLRLNGHSKLGFGLCWNEKREGQLLSGADDNKICIWDINSAKEMYSTLEPTHGITFHQKAVNDTKFHRFHPDIFGSASEDMSIGIWDMRQKLEHPSFMVISHSNEVFSIDFSPFNEHIFLSGAGDNAVCLWDLRNLSTSLYKFEGHSKSVLKVEWCPYNEAMFASCSEDRRVNVWDLSKLGETQKSEDKEPFDGPPELMFIHGGHRGKVCDFSWNFNNNMYLASTEDENNVIQIWQMAKHIYMD